MLGAARWAGTSEDAWSADVGARVADRLLEIGDAARSEWTGVAPIRASPKRGGTRRRGWAIGGRATRGPVRVDGTAADLARALTAPPGENDSLLDRPLPGGTATLRDALDACL